MVRCVFPNLDHVNTELSLSLSREIFTSEYILESSFCSAETRMHLKADAFQKEERDGLCHPSLFRKFMAQNLLKTMFMLMRAARFVLLKEMVFL